MDIKTILTNLDNTIAGKRMMLTRLYDRRELNKGADMATYAVCEFLEINIAELERIRADVALVDQ
ncbi:MAG TPA: hypothetical protein VFM18_18980 [Methanosarcina sp.]|nr:hypothetical protein [Methanosarcina sp.]